MCVCVHTYGFGGGAAAELLPNISGTNTCGCLAGREHVIPTYRCMCVFLIDDSATRLYIVPFLGLTCVACRVLFLVRSLFN